MAFEHPVEILGIRRDFHRRRGTVEVLKGIDLSVSRGEIVSLTGRSGAGKTTLLHLIAGLDVPTAGTIRIVGKDLGGMRDWALARHRVAHIGVVFQAFNLLGHLRVGENVMLPAVFRRKGRRDARRRALEVLNRVGLGDRAEDLPDQLSGGERQRVALARAVFARPEVLICDEVTGNLDDLTAAEVVSLISDLRDREGLAVVAATHDPTLMKVSDRVLSLENGLAKEKAPGDGP